MTKTAKTSGPSTKNADLKPLDPHYFQGSVGKLLDNVTAKVALQRKIPSKYTPSISSQIQTEVAPLPQIEITGVNHLPNAKVTKKPKTTRPSRAKKKPDIDSIVIPQSDPCPSPIDKNYFFTGILLPNDPNSLVQFANSFFAEGSLNQLTEPLLTQYLELIIYKKIPNETTMEELRSYKKLMKLLYGETIILGNKEFSTTFEEQIQVFIQFLRTYPPRPLVRNPHYKNNNLLGSLYLHNENLKNFLHGHQVYGLTASKTLKAYNILTYEKNVELINALKESPCKFMLECCMDFIVPRQNADLLKLYDNPLSSLSPPHHQTSPPLSN